MSERDYDRELADHKQIRGHRRRERHTPGVAV